MVRSLVASLALCAAAVTSAHAQSSVEAVQSPAWVERSGVREPLAVGMVLREADRVVSGADARVVLRMPEGSIVKVGSQAHIALDRLRVEPDAHGRLVTAAVDGAAASSRVHR
jgi:hypothetical protein